MERGVARHGIWRCPSHDPAAKLDPMSRYECDQSTLCGAALFYARCMGWEVTPLTYLLGTSACASVCSCGHSGCGRPGAHRAVGVPNAPSRESRDLIPWWDRRPHNLGIPTGATVDALDVPAGIGAIALRRMWTLDIPLGPVLTSTDRYQFLVRPSSPVTDGCMGAVRRSPAELDLRYLGVGDLLIAPPSMLPQGCVQWIGEPDAARRDLPDARNLLPILACAAWDRGPGVPVRTGASA